MASSKLTGVPVRADHHLTATLCPVFPGLCTETGDHTVHWNHQHKVRDRRGDTILDTGFVQVSDGGPALVYLSGLAHEDLLPEEVHAKTDQLRALLDQADAIADQLIARKAVA